jgi:ATP-dependent Clp protease protease subunit
MAAPFEDSPLLQPTNIVPMVIETGPRGERAFDIYSLLLRERIIYLGTPITDQVANVIIAQLLYLEREDRDRDISLYINSPGGYIASGLAILDTINLINSQVSTICVGTAASMATILLSGGAKGKRYCLPNSTIHMHQPNVGSFQGQAADIEIQAKEIVRLKERLNDILAIATGQPIEKITDDTDRDFFLTADEAIEYGIVDEILGLQTEDTEAEAA